MQFAVAKALRACGRARALPAMPLTSGTISRAALSRRTFLIAPSYKARLAVRGYATATATKKTTAAKKTPAKKTASATGKSAAAAKAKKKTTAAKKKAAPKAKKAAPKKAAPKKKEAKPPSKTALHRQKVQLRKELKEKALLHQGPKKAGWSAWQVYLFDRVKASTDLSTTGFTSSVLAISAAFKNLPPAEKQRLQQQAQDNKITNAANYKKWVESYSVADIYAANLARRRLVKEFGMKIHPVKIIDERKPKQPLTAFGQFVRAKNATYDGTAPERMKQISAEWQTLSEADKKPYNDLFLAEATKYKREQERVGL